MTDDSTHQSTHRSRLWTALAAASALALVLAAPASRADGYVDDPAYSQGYGGMGAPGVSTAAPADDEAYGAADDEEAMDGADAEEDMAAGEEAYSEDDVAMTEEEVEVTAPVIRTERSGSLTQPGRMTIVRHVGYGDLDLTTREGAGELRERVRATASGICEDLSLADPADSADFAPCYRQALLRAMPRANAAIRDARNGY